MAMLKAPAVCMTHNANTCIVVKVTERSIFAIPMAVMLELTEYKVEKFFSEFHPIDYPPDLAARRYLNAEPIIQASPAAKNQLELVAAQVPLNLFIARQDQEQARRFKAYAEGHPYVEPPDPTTQIFNPSKGKNGTAVPSRLLPAAPKPPTVKEVTMATAKKEKAVSEKLTKGKAPAAKPAAKGKAPAAKPVAAAKGKAPAAKPVAEKKERKPGVGALTIKLLLAGKTTEEILMEIREQFPESTSKATSISWYRTKLRQEGKLA